MACAKLSAAALLGRFALAVSNFVRLLAFTFAVGLLFIWIVSHNSIKLAQPAPREIGNIPIRGLMRFTEGCSGFPRADRFLVSLALAAAKP
jgi:hypothetical protein